VVNIYKGQCFPGGGGGVGGGIQQRWEPFIQPPASLCLLLRGGLFNLCSPTLIIVMNMIMYHTEDSNSCEVVRPFNEYCY
jgi:hypothetical protein